MYLITGIYWPQWPTARRAGVALPTAMSAALGALSAERTGAGSG